MLSQTREHNPWIDPLELDALHAQARVVREVIARLEPQVERGLTPDLVKRTRKIYFTGCGDSHYAGLAARLCFDKYTGIDTEPVESLEFSRYVVEFLPSDSLVFGISNSGQVSRTIETVKLARQHQAYTIAITGRAEGPLAQAADVALIQSVPELAEEMAPEIHGTLGLGNFHASLLALYLSALRIAELRGRLSAREVGQLKQELFAAADIIVRTVEENLKTARDLAAALWHLDTFYILGAGPNYGTALFSAAKLFEQPNQIGVGQELEEWAHEQYFLVRPQVTPIFVIAPPGNSRDRAIEQIHGARDMGGTVIAICDSNDEEIRNLAHWTIPVHGQLREEFSPLAYIIPG